MAQATRPISQPRYANATDQFANTIGATALPEGTLCMNDGAGNAIPFLDTTFETPTGSLLGYAQGNYAASDTGRFLFARGTPWLAPKAKAGDVPTVANLGNAISVQQNDTVKATVAANGLKVILLEIRTDGYLVQLP
jgi:hypothetical protein